jgi:WD40 repeat protein
VTALAAEARRSTAQEVDTVLLTAVAAYRTSPTGEAQTAMLEALSRSAQGVRYLHCQGAGVAYTVAFSPDGTRLAYACDRRIAVAEVKSGTTRFTAEVRGEPPRSLAFRDDTTLLIGGSSSARTLDLKTGREGRLDGAAGETPTPQDPEGLDCTRIHPPASRYAAPKARSQDGRRFAYVTETNQVITGFVDGECSTPLVGHTHNLFDLAFGGASGRWLASAGQIRTRRRHSLGPRADHPLATRLVAAGDRIRLEVAISASPIPGLSAAAMG